MSSANQSPGPPRPPRRRSGWAIFGIVLGTVLCILGLIVVGAFLLFVAAMNNYGSNK